MQVRFSREDQIGEAGQAAAMSFFNDLGWGPLPTNKHDLGTDLFVQIRADDLVDLGMMLGVQVKTGDSWFRRKAEVDGRSGWWFTENDNKHRSYWSDHHIPHILLMQDETRTRRHWVRLDRKTIESTGQGIKVFVPADQTLSGQVAEEWVALVADARKLHSFEGASWSFDITQVPEQDWPRYALLAPRIVAPHANRGYAADINWAEALALAVQADHRRWNRFAQERQNVPTADEAATSGDSGWRFAAAVAQWMAGPTDQLEALADIDLPQPLRIAHAICMSLMLESRGDRSAALDLLAGLQDREHPSIDQAWIALHRGWLHYEQGDFEDADTQVNLSVAMHNSFPSSLVNSAIRSAGVVALFDMAPFMTGDIAAVVQASDSTLSWWRNHQIENALNGYLRNSFKRWADDGSITFGASDSTHNDLVSAQFSARLLGNRRSARYAAYLRAIANLTLPRGPHAKPADQFGTLREAGYHSELVDALKRFRRDGPLAPLAEEQPPRFSGISFTPIEPHAPACDRLLLAASEEDEAWQRRIGELLLGTPDDREFAIRILSTQPGHELLLLALSGDDDHITARQALHGLARRATEDAGIARMASTVLLNALEHGGEEAALHVGGGVVAASHRCPESEPLVEALRRHQSATLRRLASELDEPPDSP